MRLNHQYLAASIWRLASGLLGSSARGARSWSVAESSTFSGLSRRSRAPAKPRLEYWSSSASVAPKPARRRRCATWERGVSRAICMRPLLLIRGGGDARYATCCGKVQAAPEPRARLDRSGARTPTDRNNAEFHFQVPVVSATVASMGILDRVSTLLRANVNDMIDRAEDPEKVVKQLIIDMNNQLLQVKTQVAASIADEKLLYRRYQDNEAKAADWQQRADLAVERGQDDMAREALARRNSFQQTA